MPRDAQHEAAIEAAAEASWRSGVSEDANWELLTSGQQAMVREEWAAGKAAYDAARSGEREGEQLYGREDAQAAIRALLKAGGWVRGGFMHWLKGAPSHILAELLNELDKEGWHLRRDGTARHESALEHGADHPEPRQDQPSPVPTSTRTEPPSSGITSRVGGLRQGAGELADVLRKVAASLRAHPDSAHYAGPVPSALTLITIALAEHPEPRQDQRLDDEEEGQAGREFNPEHPEAQPVDRASGECRRELDALVSNTWFSMQESDEIRAVVEHGSDAEVERALIAWTEAKNTRREMWELSR